MEISCEGCSGTEEVKFCEACNDYYCDTCWHQRRAHRESRVGPNGIPHGQLDPIIVKRVNKWMAAPKDKEAEMIEHQFNTDTVWFGLSKDNYGDPILAEYRRFTAVMMETLEGVSEPRYPGLVSFVGQTGAGKSSLIRLLLGIRNRDDAPLAAPVIGRGNVDVPTSADVHLFLDPASEYQRPILFADCEGFEGGERETVSQSTSSSSRLPVSSSNEVVPPLSRILHFTKRALRWASRDSRDYEKTSKRQYAVSEMYPRIFHAFSDVVVFVLNNPRTMEDVVEKLLLWADSNYSASINLPSKPHAIIVLNKSSSETPGDQWSRHRATEEFFISMDPQVSKNKTFERYMKKWANNDVTNMQDLFECYYSSVNVIRIPDKSRYQLFHEQGIVLADAIRYHCDVAQRKKRDRKMLPDADQFQQYLSLAFDHFSETLDEPFDYIKASLKSRPPPKTLADNLHEFVLLLAQTTKREGQIKWLFDKITTLVASCVMLDSARKRLFGKPHEWFSMPWADSKHTSYLDVCNDTISEYYEMHVPCSLRIKPGVTFPGGFECLAPRRAHGRMHRGRTIINEPPMGIYEPPEDFDSHTYNWGSRIEARLAEIHQDFKGSSPVEARVQAHGRILQTFYGDLSEFSFASNRICLGCLFNPAQYTLNCGHIFCRECVLDFGCRKQPCEVVLSSCPLAGSEQSCQRSDIAAIRTMPVPTHLTLEPAYAGLRILSLDGGGIRGIMELVVLRAIEDCIGVPLQRFFDIVTGTSTGGLVSLGFGHQMWSITECMEKFEGLVRQAFTKRRFQDFRGIRHLEAAWKGSRYETKAFENALQEAFGDSPLFGSLPQHPGTNKLSPLKVAVLAVSGSGTKANILSNYNVKQTHNFTRVATQHSLKGDESEHVLNYERYRHSDPKHELKVWQAARATSAAPGYFKPFIHNNEQFMDGAILHNNPIEVAVAEARNVMASSNLSLTPDIILSLGTGLQKDYKYDDEHHPKISGLVDNVPHVYGKVAYVKMVFTMLHYQVKLNTDAEDRWKKWRESIVDERMLSRVFRINVDLGRAPPRLDAVDQVTSLRDEVTGWISNNESEKQRVREIACRLVASSFYYERTGNAHKTEDSLLQLRGVIRCRLPEESHDMRSLGRFLRSNTSTTPTFIAVRGDGDDERFPVPIEDMIVSGRFPGVPVIITAPLEETVTQLAIQLTGFVMKHNMFYISGFPRSLMKNDFGSLYV
ncbi:hypothetical protein F5Y18DRAFT_418041 [Xylariaceae sp. FL1019]|nr:hypothetical protein F5Y18DRAFT_418041 [Xylariaceae sp. FL1019]